MPYSVSIPMTRRTLMCPSHPAAPADRRAPVRVWSVPLRDVWGAKDLRCREISADGGAGVVRGTRRPLYGVRSTGTAGVGDGVDGPPGFGALLAGDERADVDDPLALLAGDAGPVVGVGGVGQVLVLLELVDAGGEQVDDAQALLAVCRGTP